MRASEVVALMVCGLAVAACSKEGTGPSPAQLAGTWQVIKYEYVSTQGLGTVDLIAGGGSGTLVLTADTFRLSVAPASGAPVNITGTYEIDGIDLMRVTPAGVTWYFAFDMAFSGGTLTLTNGSGEYDFNGDTQFEPAKLNLTMTR